MPTLQDLLTFRAKQRTSELHALSQKEGQAHASPAHSGHPLATQDPEEAALKSVAGEEAVGSNFVEGSRTSLSSGPSLSPLMEAAAGAPHVPPTTGTSMGLDDETGVSPGLRLARAFRQRQLGVLQHFLRVAQT